ncbi:hypothetical protein ACFVJ9_57365, partial [Streptomyces sp. NPDC127574]
MPGPDTAPRPSGPSASPGTPPSGSRPAAQPGSHAAPRPATAPATDTVSDLVRWAAYSCVLVPEVLFWYGTSLAGATGTALGL